MWAAVSSASQDWSWRVIYSLWEGERAGDPEKGAGQGKLGHWRGEGWWESSSALGQAKGKVGGGPWERQVAGGYQRLLWGCVLAHEPHVTENRSWGRGDVPLQP